MVNYFEETEHPRAGKGSPEGGQFVAKGGGQAAYNAYLHRGSGLGSFLQASDEEIKAAEQKLGRKLTQEELTAAIERGYEKSSPASPEAYGAVAAAFTVKKHRVAGQRGMRWSVIDKAGKQIGEKDFSSRNDAERFLSGLARDKDLVASLGSEVTGIDQLDTWKETAAPKQTQRGYKVFNTDDNGNLYPAMVRDKRAIPVGKWIAAEFKGKDPNLKERPGWHMTELPLAPQMRSKKTGKINPHRVWAEVDMAVDTELQPGKQGLLGKTPQAGEFYRHKQGGKLWLIGGSVRINRVLSDDEVAKVLRDAGTDEKEIAAEMTGRVKTGIDTALEDNVFRQKWESNSGYDLQPEQQMGALLPKARLWSQNGSVEEVKKQATLALLHYGHMTGREHGVAIQVKGPNTTDKATPVMMLEGDNSHIDVPSRAVYELAKPDGGSWEYDHYHPDPMPLSGTDMNAMNKMAGIVAIHSHDNQGGSSTASFPERMGGSRGHWSYEGFKNIINESNSRAVVDFYGNLGQIAATDNEAANFLVPHARNIALAANDMISYSYELSDKQRGWLQKYHEGYAKMEKQLIADIADSVRKYRPDWESYSPPEERIKKEAKAA